MTKKQFRKAMLCGLGRCITELKVLPEKEKFFGEVMWACTHVIAWDPQSESTKSFYIREMVNCFGKTEPFVSAVMERFKKCRTRGGWKFEHYCSLLRQFALDGSREAEALLWEKYRHLYSVLSARKRRPVGCIFYDSDKFENLCIELLFMSEENAFRIARDIGSLYLQNKIYDADDFSYFHLQLCDVYGGRRVEKKLEKLSLNDSAFAEYRRKCIELEKEGTFASRQREKEEPETVEADFSSDFLSSEGALDAEKARAYVQKNGKKAVEEYFRATIGEKSAERQTRMLEILDFAFMKEYSEAYSHEDLIGLAKSGNGEISDRSYNLLEELKGEQIRNFALELYKNSSEDEKNRIRALCLLLKNYEKRDADFVVRAVASVSVRDDSDWHSVVSAVIDLFKENKSKRPPKELLQWAYENSRCSFCREYVVRAMSARRMLTEEIVQECLYDNNEEVRRFAEKKYKELYKKKKNLGYSRGI